MMLRRSLTLLLLVPTVLWAQNPKAEKALVKGEIFLKAGKPEKAIKQLEKAASDPFLAERPQVNLLLAEANLKLLEGQAKPSSAGLKGVQEVWGWLDQVQMKGQPESLEDRYYAVAEGLNKRLMSWSEASLRDDNARLAMDALDEFSEAGGGDWQEYYALRALAAQQLGDPAEEMAALEGLTYENPQEEKVYRRMLSLCRDDGCRAEVAAKAVNAGHEAYRSELARLAYNQGDWKAATNHYVKLREDRMTDDTLYTRELLFSAYQAKEYRIAADAAESLKMGGVADTNVLRAGGNAYWNLSEQSIKEEQEYTITAMGWDSGAMYNYERLFAQKPGDLALKARLRTIYIRLREKQKLYGLTGENVSRATGEVTGP